MNYRFLVSCRIISDKIPGGDIKIHNKLVLAENEQEAIAKAKVSCLSLYSILETDRYSFCVISVVNREKQLNAIMDKVVARYGDTFKKLADS